MGVGTTQRQALLAKGPPQMYMSRPGLKERKQVELYTKWRNLLPEEDKDITCPKPTTKVTSNVKATIKKKRIEKTELSKSTKKKTVIKKQRDGKKAVIKSVKKKDFRRQAH